MLLSRYIYISFCQIMIIYYSILHRQLKFRKHWILNIVYSNILVPCRSSSHRSKCFFYIVKEWLCLFLSDYTSSFPSIKTNSVSNVICNEAYTWNPTTIVCFSVFELSCNVCILFDKPRRCIKKGLELILVPRRLELKKKTEIPEKTLRRQWQEDNLSNAKFNYKLINHKVKRIQWRPMQFIWRLLSKLF